MKVLITGISSPIGLGLAKHFLAQGHSVLGLARNNAIQLKDCERFSFYSCDLRALMHTLPPVDVVLHAAALTSLSSSPSSTITMNEFFSVNTEGTRHLLEALSRENRPLFVYFSSMSVYGNVTASVVNEQTPLLALDAYGKSKIEGEKLVMCSERVQGVCIRFPGLLAPTRLHHPWLAALIANLINGAPVTYSFPDKLYNNITDVEEVVRFVLHLRETYDTHSEIVNFCATEPIPVQSIIETLHRKVCSTSSVTIMKSDAPNFFIDSTTLQSKFSFKPRSTLEILTQFATMTQQWLSERTHPGMEQ